MAKSIRTLTFRVSNAYLVETDDGFVLIDTGLRFDGNLGVMGISGSDAVLDVNPPSLLGRGMTRRFRRWHGR